MGKGTVLEKGGGVGRVAASSWDALDELGLAKEIWPGGDRNDA